MRNNTQGIDYGMGLVNVDIETGIRFGVISQHSISPEAFDEMDADYGSPTCPKCGNEADEPSAFGDSFKNGRPDDYTDTKYESDDYVCTGCKHFFGSESAFGDEASGYYYDDGGYVLHCGNDGFGIFVTKSPYYTYARYCSPCAPSACDLDSPIDIEGIETAALVKSYCLGHDWFDDENPAPYRIFRVSDDTEVKE